MTKRKGSARLIPKQTEIPSRFFSVGKTADTGLGRNRLTQLVKAESYRLRFHAAARPGPCNRAGGPACAATENT